MWKKKFRFQEIFWLDKEVLHARVEPCRTELEALRLYGKYLYYMNIFWQDHIKIWNKSSVDYGGNQLGDY